MCGSGGSGPDGGRHRSDRRVRPGFRLSLWEQGAGRRSRVIWREFTPAPLPRAVAVHFQRGQANLKRGSAFGPVVAGDLSLVVLDHAVGRAESETGAFADRLGGVERIEDALGIAQAGAGSRQTGRPLRWSSRHSETCQAPAARLPARRRPRSRRSEERPARAGSNCRARAATDRRSSTVD